MSDFFLNGSVILWDIRDLSHKDHRNLRVNIEFDYASHIAWSPDSRGIVVHTVRENQIMGYKVEKKKDLLVSVTQAITFDKMFYKDSGDCIYDKSSGAGKEWIQDIINNCNQYSYSQNT
ncbi:unnamed protein product [Colias eurytheme]|nr:unnamed protein product [Colias eurytheme]